MMVLTGNYITGAFEADGCFVGFELDSSRAMGFRPDLRVTFSQSMDNKDFVKAIQGFFKVGKLQGRSESYGWACDIHGDLTNIIIPHFNKYPLVGEKLNSFIILEMVLLKLNQPPRQHPPEKYFWVLAGLSKLNPERRKETAEYWVNRITEHYSKKKKPINQTFAEVSKEFDLQFKENVKRYKTKILSTDTLRDEYIVGLTQGDGCFSPATPVESCTKFVFDISFYRHPDNRKLQRMVENFFHKSTTFQQTSEQCDHFKISSIAFLKSDIIPFFDKNPLGFRKGRQFENFKNNMVRITGSLYVNIFFNCRENKR